jgi:RNA polymerase sigma factor (TIGR02999 family)
MSAAPEPQKALTQLLSDMQAGQPGAADKLLSMVYDELRRIAANYMRRERPGHTLQATALVHEAYLELIGQTRVNWQSRAHFFGVAAQLMRRILVEHARRAHALKRGGSAQRMTLDEVSNLIQERDIPLEALDDSLKALEEMDPQQAKIVELRFFGGLTVEETADVLETSTATVEREWRMAKAWLHCQLRNYRAHSQFLRRR